MKNSVLLVFCLLLISPVLAFGDAVLTLSMGKVDIKSAGATKWEPVKINMTILSSDTIRVGKKSKAVLKLSDGSTINVPALKVMKLSDIENQKGSAGNKSLSQLLKEKGIKLSKTGSGDTGITAVAGVRGADVDSQKNKVKASELKWKD